MLHTFLVFVQVFSSIAIVALVLVQRGKGSDAGAGFGAGASGTVFGARGARTGLSRATAVLAAVFMLNSLALAYVGTQRAEAPRTIFDEVGTEQSGPGAQPTESNVPSPSSIPAAPAENAPAQ